MAAKKKTRNENGVVALPRVIHKLTQALLLHQSWKKKVGFCSLFAVDGCNCLLDLSEIEKVLMDIKADDVKVIPVPKHCDWADFMVLATGRSTWHVNNIAQALIYKAPHPPSFVDLPVARTMKSAQSQCLGTGITLTSSALISIRTFSISDRSRRQLRRTKNITLPSSSMVDEEEGPLNITNTPDGKLLVFLSARSAVDSGVHNATNSLHRIDWLTNGKPFQSSKIDDMSFQSILEIPVVMCAEDGCFPGLYCTIIHSNPWLSDNCTMIISSIWHSSEVLLSVNVLSGEIVHSPVDPNFSWNLLTLDGNNIVAISSSPVDFAQIRYGKAIKKETNNTTWSWSNISSPIFRCSDKVRSLLSSLQSGILRISVKDAHAGQTKGFQVIPNPTDKEPLQSLPGNVGSQDVNDVLSAIDHVINLGLASPSKITVMGISHGGFLTTQLIGQRSIFAVGMICCDAEGRLNEKSVILQSSIEHSGGECVRLDLQRLNHYSIFPGQVVGIGGHNPSGHCFIASKLVDSIPIISVADENLNPLKKQAIDKESQSTIYKQRELSMIIAAGPFTTTDNLLFEPLTELLQYAKRRPPQLLVLLGPFVDSELPDTGVEDYVEHVGSGTRVLLVPSIRDANHDFVFPQPALEINLSDFKSQIVSLANPGIFEANEVKVGCCTVDVLKQISGEEISRTAADGKPIDRMSRLANHILNQQSFYPLYPPAESVPLDFSLAPEALKLSLVPDVLILPSDIKHFVKVKKKSSPH
ncbi:Acylamino-acid-releasing enzyme 2 [Vigna angularis]|uniref:DNA polymerase alpha subunit B n=1 Tax=Phaseolus angularis TaxID=3914 RepID=A0A8T0JMJ4_PHAAN|nr:Acylamino-acid-releasing enzyme 2 [Vigna angularis]